MSSPAFVLFFTAFLALSYAQCSVDGASYNVGNFTWTFGAVVGTWNPVIVRLDDGGVIRVTFATARLASTAVDRWELQDVGTFFRGELTCGSTVGQYHFQFAPDCNSFTVALIYDECTSRGSLINGLTLTATTLSSCPTFVGTLAQSSALAPQFSGEVATIVPAMDGLYMASIGSQASVFQYWTQGATDPANLYRIQDIMSIPAPYSCEYRYYGQYYLTVDSGCSAILCGKSDSCPARASLLPGLELNGYSGDPCPSTVDVLEFSNSACSDGNIWTKSPHDCTSQLNGATCMYCHGVANGLDLKLCLERNGGICNDIFRSIPAKGWCNLEFECPASTLSLSVFALFFIFLSLLVM